MMLTPLNQFGSETQLLDIRNLVEGMSYSLLAYVCNVKSGTTVNETGFYSFYVKDRRGNIIPARLFNVEKFYESGFTANSLRNRPVKMNCIAQIVYGQWSLLVKEIVEWTGDFDYRLFKGQVDCDKDYLEEKYSSVGVCVPTKYYTVSIPSICDGKCGGYALLISIVLRKIDALCKHSYLSVKQLTGIVINIASGYMTYAEMKDTAGFASKAQMIKIMNSYVMSDATDAELDIDALTGLADLGAPRFLESALVVKTFKDTIQELSMINSIEKIPKGSSASCGGYELFRI